MPGAPSAVGIGWPATRHVPMPEPPRRCLWPANPDADDGPMTHLGIDQTQEQRCEASDLSCPWDPRGLDHQLTVVSEKWSAFADPTICLQRAKRLAVLTSAPTPDRVTHVRSVAASG
jgi:hypothetical protein